MKTEATRFPVLPTLLTLGNALCGLGAISLASQALGEEAFELNLYNAGLLIFLGMLFDMLDGRVAVWTKQTSEFGGQLDSLCDAITFGVAPAFMMLVFSRQLSYVDARFFNGIAALFTLCAILRLARYNVENNEESSSAIFHGLPTPAAAGLIAAFAISLPKIAEIEATPSLAILGATLNNMVFITIPIWTIVVSYLMVSRVRYPHVTKQLIRASRTSPTHSFYRLVQITFAIVIILTLHELALPILFIYYVVGSPMLAITRRATARIRSHSQDGDYSVRTETPIDPDQSDATTKQDAHSL
jgi:CDP-diacylglycerol--serine O-phosphatidyltransferase